MPNGDLVPIFIANRARRFYIQFSQGLDSEGVESRRFGWQNQANPPASGIPSRTPSVVQGACRSSLQGAADETAPWLDGPLAQFRGAATVVLLLVLGGIPQAGPLCVLFRDLHYGVLGFPGRYL